jgi:hypothetical protein
MRTLCDPQSTGCNPPPCHVLFGRSTGQAGGVTAPRLPSTVPFAPALSMTTFRTYRRRQLGIQEVERLSLGTNAPPLRRALAASEEFLEKLRISAGIAFLPILAMARRYSGSIEALNEETSQEIKMRHIDYLNKIVEQDHRVVMRAVPPKLGLRWCHIVCLSFCAELLVLLWLNEEQASLAPSAVSSLRSTGAGVDITSSSCSASRTAGRNPREGRKTLVLLCPSKRM